MNTDTAPNLDWFLATRFGLFIHSGAYSGIARGEWVMNQEGMSPEHIRDWCRLAREIGMRYVVFTAKHHDGLCLWNSARSPFNSVQRGPRRGSQSRPLLQPRRLDTSRPISAPQHCKIGAGIMA